MRVNLPNALTLFRILLIPAFVWVYFTPNPMLALCLYILASLTDLLDGFLARKLNQITNFGKLADPLADKLMLMALLVCLAITGQVPWWVMILIAVKELYMMAGSLYMLKHKIVVSSNGYGKTATFLFIVALALVFPWHPANMLSTMGTILLYLAVALSLLSAFIYTRNAMKKLESDC